MGVVRSSQLERDTLENVRPSQVQVAVICQFRIRSHSWIGKPKDHTAICIVTSHEDIVAPKAQHRAANALLYLTATRHVSALRTVHSETRA